MIGRTLSLGSELILMRADREQDRMRLLSISA